MLAALLSSMANPLTRSSFKTRLAHVASGSGLALSDSIRQTALIHGVLKRLHWKTALTSYADVGEADRDCWLSTFVPGILAHCDLFDCYRVLDGTKLRQIEPRDRATATPEWIRIPAEL